LGVPELPVNEVAVTVRTGRRLGSEPQASTSDRRLLLPNGLPNPKLSIALGDCVCTIVDAITVNIGILENNPASKHDPRETARR